MSVLKWFLFAVAIFYANTGFSQYYYYNSSHYDRDLLFEVGGGIGAINSITDIGGAKGKGGMYINDIGLKFTRLSGSVYFSALYQQLVGVRLEATWGSLEGADSVLKGASHPGSVSRYNRNLNFRTNINEVAAIAEFYPLTLFAKEQLPVLSPYLMAGLGYYRFNPQINVNGRYVDARPLRTEGQEFPGFKDNETYNTKQVNVPVGIGVKYELSQRFTIRAEFLHRFLFTDYLDDVSRNYTDRSLFDQYLSPVQADLANAVYDLKREGEPVPGKARGNPDSKDSYMTFTIKMGVTLGRERR